MQFVDLHSQYKLIENDLKSGIEKVLEHGRYVFGAEIESLECALKNSLGSKHAVACSSGTDALLIAMMALDITVGDEVITTPFTFIATGEMIALLGAVPVFVDIDPHTYNIDPAAIEAAISTKTKAIMPVSLYGQCADMDAINAIGKKYRIPVIEDGAQSLGGTYKGQQSCALSTIACTSFFPSKPLGAYGDGGMCFTNDDNLAKAMREVLNHGQDRRYHHPRIGINARLDTMQAAVLLAKLKIFPDEVNSRGRIGARYSQLINERCKNVTTPYIHSDCTSVYAQYTILIDDREGLIAHLNDAGVPTAVHYPIPLNKQPVFDNGATVPVAEDIAKRVMSLPMHPYLDEATQDEIVGHIANFVNHC